MSGGLRLHCGGVLNSWARAVATAALRHARASWASRARRVGSSVRPVWDLGCSVTVSARDALSP